MGPGQQGLWSATAPQSKLSLSESSWTTGYDFAWGQVTEWDQGNDVPFSQSPLVPSGTLQAHRQHCGPLFAMNSTNKVRPSSHNEVNYCLARHTTSAPSYLTCTKLEQIRNKNQCLILLTKHVALSPHIKNTFQEYLVLSLEFYPFDFNYKLKAIVTQNFTFCLFT